MPARACLDGVSASASTDQALPSQHGRGLVVPVPYSLVHQAFESIVDSHPTAIAATIGGRTITYQQLDIAANGLAHHLIESGLEPRQRVCLVVQRSFEMLIGIFAILKAGCQYVPIDGGVASEQALQHIFVDTGAKFILCLPKYLEKTHQFANDDTVIIDLSRDTSASPSTERPQVSVSSSDGAYIIYTSGPLSAQNVV